MLAEVVNNTIVVDVFYILDGKGYAEVAIDPNDCYDSYKKLPAVIKINGRSLVKTAYNSDKNIAYYQQGNNYATF